MDWLDLCCIIKVKHQTANQYHPLLLGYRCRLNWRSGGSSSSSPTTCRSGAAFKALPSSACGNALEDNIRSAAGRATLTTRPAPLHCTRIPFRWLCVQGGEDWKWPKLRLLRQAAATQQDWTFWPGRACRAAMEKWPWGRPWKKSWRRVSSDHFDGIGLQSSKVNVHGVIYVPHEGPKPRICVEMYSGSSSRSTTLSGRWCRCWWSAASLLYWSSFQTFGREIRNRYQSGR